MKLLPASLDIYLELEREARSQFLPQDSMLQLPGVSKLVEFGRICGRSTEPVEVVGSGGSEARFGPY